jgi:hypothetical protein
MSGTSPEDVGSAMGAVATGDGVMNTTGIGSTGAGVTAATGGAVMGDAVTGGGVNGATGAANVLGAETGTDTGKDDSKTGTHVALNKGLSVCSIVCMSPASSASHSSVGTCPLNNSHLP